MKPVNGQCPDGYILIEGGDDGPKCVKNPFQVIKNPETGKLEYDKEALDALSRYVKSYISGLPKDKVKDEGVLYDTIFSKIIQGSGGSTRDPLTKAYLSGDKNEINNAVNSASKFYESRPFNSFINHIGTQFVRYPEGQIDKEYESVENFPEEYRYGNQKQTVTTPPITQTSSTPSWMSLAGSSGGFWRPNAVPQTQQTIVDDRLMTGGEGQGSGMDAFTPPKPQGLTEILSLSPSKPTETPYETSSRTITPQVDNIDLQQSQSPVGLTPENNPQQPKKNMGILQQALGNATDFLSNLFGSASKGTPISSNETQAQQPINISPTTPTPAQPVTPPQPVIPGMPTGNLSEFGGKVRFADGSISGEDKVSQKEKFNQLKLAMSQSKIPVSNQDFYVDSGDIQLGNAGTGGYSAPIYGGGEAVLFPIAGYDKMRQRREQERMMSDIVENQTRAKMVFDLPQIDQKTVLEKVMPQYNQQLFGLMAELKNDYGADLYKKGATDPRTLSFMSKWKSIPQAINDLTTNVKSYFETIEKDKQSGKLDLYDSPITRALGQEILGGLNSFWKDGNVSAEELYQAGQKFTAFKNLDTDIKNAIKVIPMSQDVPLLDASVQRELSMNPQANQEYMRLLELPGNPPDYKQWVIAKHIKEYTDQQALAYADSFMNSNPGSAEAQLSLPGDDPAKVRELVRQRVADSFQSLAGKQVEALFNEYQQRKGSSFNFNLGTGGGAKGQGFYESTVLGNDKIVSSINELVKKPGVTADQVLNESFGGSWRTIPNDPYARVHVPGAVFNKETTPLRYNDYVHPSLASGTGAVSGQFAPIGKDKQGNDILSSLGVQDRNQTPKKAIITDVQFGYAVRDPKTQQWNLITKANMEKNGLLPGAKLVVIEENMLYDAEKTQVGGFQQTGPSKGLKAYRVYEATLEATRPYDNMTNPATSNEGAINPGATGGGTQIKGSITVEDASL